MKLGDDQEPIDPLDPADTREMKKQLEAVYDQVLVVVSRLVRLINAIDEWIRQHPSPGP